MLIGRHIENGQTQLACLGLEITLAILMVLMPDSYADAYVERELKRLISIFAGMAILWPVLLIWHLFTREAEEEDPDGAAGPSSE